MSHSSFRDVSVYGSSIIPFGKFPQLSLSSLARPAVVEALKDSGVERQNIQALSNQLPSENIEVETVANANC